MTKPFDPNLPCQTRDGRKVRILCTDARGTYPIVGTIDGNLETWKEDGVNNPYAHEIPNPKDLINTPPSPRYRAWTPEEAAQHVGKVVKHNTPTGLLVRAIVAVYYGKIWLGGHCDSDIGGHEPHELVNNYTFLDNTPCGTKGDVQ